MAESKMMTHATRTTKRGGQNSRPDDPFKIEPEVSMDALAQAPSSDGRNPDIASGKGGNAMGSEKSGRP